MSKLSISDVMQKIQKKMPTSSAHSDKIRAAICQIMANLPSALSQEEYLQRVLDALDGKKPRRNLV